MTLSMGFRSREDLASLIEHGGTLDYKPKVQRRSPRPFSFSTSAFKDSVFYIPALAGQDQESGMNKVADTIPSASQDDESGSIETALIDAGPIYSVVITDSYSESDDHLIVVALYEEFIDDGNVPPAQIVVPVPHRKHLSSRWMHKTAGLLTAAYNETFETCNPTISEEFVITLLANHVAGETLYKNQTFLWKN